MAVGLDFVKSLPHTKYFAVITRGMKKASASKKGLARVTINTLAGLVNTLSLIFYMLIYHSRGGDDTQRGLNDEPSLDSNVAAPKRDLHCIPVSSTYQR